MRLSLQNVSVTLGEREIVSRVTLDAERGALLALVGPNGAGKTTLLKAIASLIPFSGNIAWDGENLTRMRAGDRAKRLAYLPQGHVAHWPITAREAVAIGRAPFASSLGRLSAADNAAIDEAMHQVEATAFAHRRITELSGGERARVMLARALAVGAPLLLADEPTASLDPSHQLGVMGLLRDIARSGKLVIAVIHDLVLAARFADQVLVLDQGRMAAFGPPDTTLTAEVMREVFQVEGVQIDVDGRNILAPWRPVAASRASN